MQTIKLTYGKIKLIVNKNEPFLYYATFIADEYSRLDIKEGDFVIDAGANIGDFSVKSAKLVGSNGKVIAIEPDQNNVEILKKNLDLNQLKNVSIVQQALSDSGDGAFLQQEGVVASIAGKKNGRKVNTVTINDLINEFSGDRQNIVLKMDIEGGEELVFKDPTFLLKVREIAMELHGKNNITDIPNKLKNYGFTIYNFTSHDEIKNTIKNFIRHPLNVINAEFKTNFIATRGAFKTLIGENPIPSINNSDVKVIYAARKEH